MIETVERRGEENQYRIFQGTISTFEKTPLITCLQEKQPVAQSAFIAFFFFFALPVGATEERPEPSLKMFFFCFKNVPFVTLATEPESSTGRITLSIAALR